MILVLNEIYIYIYILISSNATYDTVFLTENMKV